MNKIAVKLGLLLLLSYTSQAQLISAGDKRKLREKEDTLKEYAMYMITDTTTADRMISDSIFTRTLVRALQIKNSFYYPFDSVQGVSRLYAPDSSFRIFTWNMQFDDYYCRQKGAIQMRTKDGSLKLLPLRDVSEFTDKAEDSARSRSNWIGAIYYNIIKTQYNNRNYYTLFGIDYNTVMSTKKWVEVMYFDQKGEPVFGGPFFSYAQDSIPQPTAYRFSLEFKKDTRVLLNYISDLGVILSDHLISETDEPDHKWTYIPDGDNEAFKWEGGKWVHIDKAFDYKVDMRGIDPYLGNPPVEDPLLDKNGNTNQKKLEEKSEKNKAKEKPKTGNNGD
ncbi:MAG: hypothetical protein E6Q24_03550 [Chitinophagaceae bacterium]|jgi:hypothetical protein|nr:hypothetical protein [Sphingobacteriales bacterium]OJV99447.1 MAG: hypothetical protein BGO52_12360 [Sphingobacteriales bacterium 44-61]TXJ28764.1 MAG: hypothetical protein E6Q24_03550 [Chitinophagaceae bacterium]